jgi:hypothetical protein
MAAFDPAPLVGELRAAGLTVRADAGTIRVSPAGRLTPEQATALKANKPAVLDWLTREATRGKVEAVLATAPGWRIGCSWLVELPDGTLAIRP